MKQRQRAMIAGKMILLEQEQTAYMLTPEDWHALEMIPTEALIYELERRGAIAREQTPAAEIMAIMQRCSISLRDLPGLLIEEAIRRYGSQKAAAKALGISTRAICYHATQKPKRLVEMQWPCDVEDNT